MNQALGLMRTLSDMGILPQLYRAGIINPSVKEYYEYHLQVEAHMKTNGGLKNIAVKDVSAKVDKDERTIWRALKFFNESEVAPAEG